MTDITNQHQQQSEFLIVWFGQLISSIGSGLTAFTLGIYVFQQTGSATRFSLILLAAFLPSLLLKPIGGALSDRLDRRWLMITGDLGSATGILFILFLTAAGLGGIWFIYTGVIISSAFSALHNPAYKASVTDLVSQEFYTNASGLMQLAESSRYLISPIVAGFLLNIMTLATVLLIDVLTFLMAAFAVLWIKKQSRKETGRSDGGRFLAECSNGFQYTYANKGVFYLLLVTSLITFFVGFLQALLGPMILAFAEAEALGTIQSTAATGMIASSLFIGVFSKTRKHVMVLAVSLGLAGLFFALLGVSTSVRFITISGFAFFFMLPFINTSLDVLIRTNVDNTIQGRVWSIVSLISQSGMVIAFGIAGILADHVFNPLLLPGGVLASSVGTVIGIGEGRGIGLMFILAGFSVSFIALLIAGLKTITALGNPPATGNPITNT